MATNELQGCKSIDCFSWYPSQGHCRAAVLIECGWKCRITCLLIIQILHHQPYSIFVGYPYDGRIILNLHVWTIILDLETELSPSSLNALLWTMSWGKAPKRSNFSPAQNTGRERWGWWTCLLYLVARTISSNGKDKPEISWHPGLPGKCPRTQAPQRASDYGSGSLNLLPLTKWACSSFRFSG